MTTTSRQNNLILNQDWTRIYQTFKNADFKSYDFENLRRVIITYLRENYPEDFNDYIESSEYMALIDAIAFIGQSLSFRIDLASRENFLELADRRESVLRIARMLGYNAKRNIPASGLLKFTTVSTTEELVDSNGRNLSDQIVSWNDPTNTNWLEQFLLILNSAMADNTEFGRSQGTGTIQGINTEQYRFKSAISDIPLFSFNKTVASRTMNFELVSTSFRGQEYIYEEPPTPGNQLGFIYRQDGKGPGSANTGFFMMFKQGSLELADFTVDVPTTNETIAVGAENINNDDVWLFNLDSNGTQTNQWTKVSSLTGNNIAYNSLQNSIRNIYAVSTKENDTIELVFADGVYGNLPQGTFRVYYRVSNGLSYSISPAEMRGVTVSVPYVSKTGNLETLTVGLGLNYTVTSASAAESTDNIRTAAPALYYTQNRMITAEDYQLAPLTSSQEILKVKSINRTSSGISRNYEIIDASGKYSSVRVFADDGYVYREEIERNLNLKFANRLDIINFIRNKVEPIFTSTDVYNFYFTKFDKVLFVDENIIWRSVSTGINQSTGYFQNKIDASILGVGAFSTSSLKYIYPNSLIKFVPPAGKAFKNGKIVDADVTDLDQRSYIWTKVISVAGDGTAANTGTLSSGLGPVMFSDVIPDTAIARRIVPKFVNNLPTGIEQEIVSQLIENQNFGLRYDYTTSSWKVIIAPNLDLVSLFSLGKAGDNTRNNLDASWIIAFVKKADQYVIRVRGMDYVFGSLQQNRFYIDINKKVFNAQTGEVVRDEVKVLGINAGADSTALKRDIAFSIDSTIKFNDGYESDNEIKIAFSDRDDDGVIDDPEAFSQIVGEDTELKFIFFKETKDSSGNVTFEVVDETVTPIAVVQREATVNLNDYTDGDLIYFYDINENRVKKVDKSTNTLILQPSYKANFGRKGLKFQYVHNASEDRRIDPSSSNIIDVFLLTRNYDTAFRNYVLGNVLTQPEAPSIDSLRIEFGSKLNNIKSISDEIVYHPVKYKVLFGSQAEDKLQATFKIVKNPNKTINDNDLKVRIVLAINEFFDINNWDFGDKFYLSELTTYVLNSVVPDVSNLIVVPKQSSQSFESLFEIQSRSDEIFISGAKVDDIEIVTTISGITSDVTV
jgi:hypothetical protein